MKTKTNQTAPLLVGHVSIVAILGSIDSTFDNPQVVLETVGSVLRKTFLPADITIISKTFKKVAKDLGFAKKDFVTRTLTALKRQDNMGVDKAKTQYRPLHTVLLSKISSIFIGESSATTQLRTLLSIADVTTVPTGALTPMKSLFQYMAAEIGVAKMGWVVVPLAGLEHRIATAGTNGQAKTGDDLDPAIADQTGADADSQRVTG